MGPGLWETSAQQDRPGATSHIRGSEPTLGRGAVERHAEPALRLRVGSLESALPSQATLPQ